MLTDLTHREKGALLNSREGRDIKKPLHIALVGFGDVAEKLFTTYMEKYAGAKGLENHIRFTVLSRSYHRVEGRLRDIKSGILTQHSDNPTTPYDCVDVMATDGYKDIEGADLVIVTASNVKGASLEGRTRDNYRMTAGSYDKGTIFDICHKIAGAASDALLFMGTNQTDLMAHMAREICNPKKVLGFGCAVDTSRLKVELRQELKDNPSKYGNAEQLKAAIKSTYVIGYHDGPFMHPVWPSDLQKGFSEEFLRETFENVRSAGPDIAFQAVKDGRPAQPPHCLPGVTFARTVASLTGEEDEITFSYNIMPDDDIAKGYGVEAGHKIGLGIPVTFRKGSYEAVSAEKIGVTEEAGQLLRQHQQAMMDLYVQFAERPPPTPIPAGYRSAVAITA